MADPAEKKTQDIQEQGRSAARSAAQTTNEAVQRAASAGEQTARRGADALRSQGAAAADAARSTAETGAEVIGRAGAGASAATRRAVESAAEAQRRFIEGASSRLAQVLSEAAQERAHDMRMLMTLPNFSGDGFAEMQRGAQMLVERTMEANRRSAEAIFQLADPVHFVSVQQQFVREYLHALFESSAIMLRSARQMADETLRPLEQHVEQHRQRDGYHVADVMTPDVRVVGPDETVQQAARIMREEDIGALPVGESDRLVGMVTDRDLAVRLAAEGRDPSRTKVREVMTNDVRYLFEDEDLGHAAENMAEQQVRRLPVVNRAKRLVGVVTLSDVARKERHHERVGRALAGIAREGGEHTQTAAE